MSYRVTIVADSPEELTEKVEALLTRGLVGKTFVSHTGPETTVDEESEYEEVPSQFSNHAPSINTSVVVDNEKDSEGLPWDSRIHSGGKSKNNDGTWKKKKGVDAAEVVRVKAELFNRGASAPVQTPPAPTASAPVETPAQPAAPVTTPALPSAALPQVQTGHTLQSFQSQFALVMSNLITQGKLTQEYVNTLKGHFGVAEIWQATPEQQAACFSEFVKCGLIQQVG